MTKKPRTFMQKYREWERLQGKYRANADKHCITHYGRELANQFDLYDTIKHSVTSCNVHKRINMRACAIASLGEEWSERSLDLNRRWREWS